MRFIHLLSAAAALAAGLYASAAAAAPARPAARPAPAPTPGYVVKLTNADTMAVTAVYASPSGKTDWSDDLLGSQTAAAGRTVTLNFKLLPPELCKQDLQLLMNDGKTLTKEGLDVCATPDYRFTR